MSGNSFILEMQLLIHKIVRKTSLAMNLGSWGMRFNSLFFVVSIEIGIVSEYCLTFSEIRCFNMS